MEQYSQHKLSDHQPAPLTVHKPNLIERLGFIGPFKNLSPEQKRIYLRAYRSENPDKVRAWNAKNRSKYSREETAKRWRAWADKNREYLKEAQQKRQKNDPNRLEKCRASYRRHAQKRIEAVRQWRIKNREKHRNTQKLWREKNREKLALWHKERWKRRYYSEPQYRISCRLRGRLYELIRKSGAMQSVSLKMDKKAIVEHIEKQFLPGMSWQNHGSVWHIDHIIPCSAFDLTVKEQREYCFSLENLRPLWAKDNLQKNDKIPDGIVLPFPLKTGTNNAQKVPSAERA